TGDITESHTLWDKDKRNASEACPILLNGTYYQITRGGILSAIDAKTGKDLWEDRLQGRFLSSPIVLGDKLLICNDPGQCYLVKASPEKFEVTGTNTLPELITASPVVADGALFIRSAGALYKIAKK
ncbi:MAG: PQQ-binding-like beta-propeller repeat protein, partial [Verrucomicrobiaceae bacterium]|nr:PQQ-binding-like beta-propeller repeat protein [Verrucomicrobiaceae bacterium]